MLFISPFLLFPLLLSSSIMSTASTTTNTTLISFLQRIQTSAHKTLSNTTNFDPKFYVDLPLNTSILAAESAFNALLRFQGTIQPHDLSSFLDDHFGKPGSDLVEVLPVDFVDEPEGFLTLVENYEVRKWGLEVHGLWRELSRKVALDVGEKPELHTLIALPESMVVPGERFREVYYWDSYWTIRGLLASKMYHTAKSIVRNLIYLIDVYGFVLNGSRSYYTNRSQPPLLSAMIREIFKKTGDLDLVKSALPSLLKEHKFWTSGKHKVTIQDADGRIHSMSRYYAMWDKPRPESATLDEESASELSTNAEKRDFYRQLATAAESGWDFSSRWMSQSSKLTTLATTSIIPVDLNAFLYKMELDIAFFAKLTGDKLTSENFVAAAEARKTAIMSILWNSDMSQWLDYWLISDMNCKEEFEWEEQYQNRSVFASNFVPLWVGLNSSDGFVVDKVVESFKKSGLLQPAGIATSLSNTGQQWDFPNGWAPLQHMIVEGFANSDSTEARHLAKEIVVRWVRTNYATFRSTGAMHEKYDVEACGKIGAGGEYKPQTGFGWSNGVVLSFLEEFGWPCDQEIECQ